MLASRFHSAIPSNRVFSLKSNTLISYLNPSTGLKISCLTKVLTFQRCKATQQQSSQNSSLTESKDNERSQLTIGEKVKQTTKDASYLGVIIAGVGVTGLMFYAILRELFSSHSPNSIYTQALKICKNDERVMDAVGVPIKGFGEETARGRRRHVSHLEYIKNGVNYMQMKFYIKGSRRKGTVHLEMKENDKKKYDYRYLFVELEGYPSQTIILKDNRDL